MATPGRFVSDPTSTCSEPVPGCRYRRCVAASTTAGLKPERIFAGYMALQAAAGVGFWVLLRASGTVRGWIELLPAEHAVTDAFLFADLAVGVVGSALSAWGLWAGRRWALPAVAFTTGGIIYPTLFLLSWVAYTGEGTPCLAVMVPPSILSTWVLVQTWRTSH